MAAAAPSFASAASLEAGASAVATRSAASRSDAPQPSTLRARAGARRSWDRARESSDSTAGGEELIATETSS